MDDEVTAAEASLKGSPATLIKEVHIRRPIWDLKNPAHHNRDIVQKLWTEIGDKLELPLDFIKNKWKHLRDNFRSELKKIIKGTGKPPRPYQSQWVFFGDLQFLEEQMMRKITRLYSSLPNEYGDDMYSYEGVTNDSEGSESNNATCSTTDFLTHSVFVDETSTQVAVGWWPPQTEYITDDCIPSENKRRRLSGDTSHEKGDPLVEDNSTKPKSNPNVSDDDFHFMMSLLPYVHKLSPPQKMRLRSKIQQLICEFVYNINDTNKNNISNNLPITFTDFDENPVDPLSISNDPLSIDG